MDNFHSQYLLYYYHMNSTTADAHASIVYKMTYIYITFLTQVPTINLTLINHKWNIRCTL